MPSASTRRPPSSKTSCRTGSLIRPRWSARRCKMRLRLPACSSPLRRWSPRDRRRRHRCLPCLVAAWVAWIIDRANGAAPPRNARLAMIRYALACDEGHAFESWFGNSATYDRQVKRGLVSCPVCNSTKVEKAIMAPRVAGTKRRGDASVSAPMPEGPAARMVSSSSHVEGDAVHDVVVVAARIVDQFARLRLADLIGGACHDHLLAGRLRQKIVAEGAEGEAAEILAQRCGDPSLAAVARRLDPADAVAAVPGDAADGGRSHPHVRAVRGIGHQRVHHHLGDRRIH